MCASSSVSLNKENIYLIKLTVLSSLNTKFYCSIIKQNALGIPMQSFQKLYSSRLSVHTFSYLLLTLKIEPPEALNHKNTPGPQS